MPTPQDYPVLTVRKNEERRLLAGHQWAFSNELVGLPKDIPSGSIVKLIREQNQQPFALAFYNPHSLIAARILTRDLETSIDEEFIAHRLRAAYSRRSLLLQRRNAARIVHSESDFLPGLVIDKFDDVISFQIGSAGIELLKEQVVRSIERTFSPKSIVEKNTSHARKLEGLEPFDRVVFGSDATAEIFDERGTRYEVDVLNGQKTGFYLDQMENRTRIRDYVKPGSRALDLFSNEGGFALNLRLAGAGYVKAVDSSSAALAMLRKNAALNSIADGMETVEADCFDYLATLEERFDFVVLDPPALVKSKRELAGAARAYQSLNSHAIRLTEREGILATASCSHHVTGELFKEIVRESARKARRSVSILEECGAGIDHPVLLEMPETEYLHLLILRVH